MRAWHPTHVAYCPASIRSNAFSISTIVCRSRSRLPIVISRYPLLVGRPITSSGSGFLAALPLGNTQPKTGPELVQETRSDHYLRETSHQSGAKMPVPPNPHKQTTRPEAGHRDGFFTTLPQFPPHIAFGAGKIASGAEQLWTRYTLHYHLLPVSPYGVSRLEVVYWGCSIFPPLELLAFEPALT
jgi:hypothetical protein